MCRAFRALTVLLKSPLNSLSLLAVAEQHVILGHQARTSSSLGGEGGSLSRGTDGSPNRDPSDLNQKDLQNPRLSGAPGDSPH
jgi:hypothetical protein